MNEGVAGDPHEPNRYALGILAQRKLRAARCWVCFYRTGAPIWSLTRRRPQGVPPEQGILRKVASKPEPQRCFRAFTHLLEAHVSCIA